MGRKARLERDIGPDGEELPHGLVPRKCYSLKESNKRKRL